jgi:DNA-binding NarL/FixJ family response regulator
MRVLIVDERPSVRAALRAALEHDAQCGGIDEAGGGDDALASLAFGADVVVLEWELHGLAAATFIAVAKARRPGIVVVVLGHYAEAGAAALAAGADFYVDVSQPFEDFVGLLHKLCRTAGQATVLPPSVPRA